MAHPKLEVKNVSKSFPGVKALIDVSFHINPGEIVSLVGENGAGKSTLINVISGQIQPESGTVWINGEEVKLESPTDAIERGVGLVPQELNLIPQLTVAENIYLGIRKVKKGIIPMIDWRQMRVDAEEVLHSLGASLDANQIVENMSVADQQMVQIARALCLGADILIFDEPTACLTIKETEKLLKLIMQFKESGKSVIFVSHHLDEVIRISDRVTVMRDGAHIEDIDRDQLSIPRLIKGMVGRDMEHNTTMRNKVSPDAPTFLKVEGLSCEGEFTDISFDVKKGEVFGIAGLVGAGRTELVSAIFGEHRADQGTVWLDGEDLKKRTPNRSIKKGIGFVPEERRKFSILPTMCIRENLSAAIWGRLYHIPTIDRKQEREIVETYAGQVKVKMASAEGLLTKLSGGNQQKVVIARWLAAGCKLLIIDEPTRGIDVLAKEEIYKLIHKCTDDGMTVLAVSSEMEELISICNRILIMHEGKQKGIVNTDSITPEEILNIALS